MPVFQIASGAWHIQLWCDEHPFIKHQSPKSRLQSSIAFADSVIFIGLTKLQWANSNAGIIKWSNNWAHQPLRFCMVEGETWLGMMWKFDHDWLNTFWDTMINCKTTIVLVWSIGPTYNAHVDMLVCCLRQSVVISQGRYTKQMTFISATILFSVSILSSAQMKINNIHITDTSLMYKDTCICITQMLTKKQNLVIIMNKVISLYA